MAVSWAIPATVLAVAYLVRESVEPAREAVAYVEDLVDDSITRTIEATEAAAGAVAGSGEYYGKLLRDKMRENAARAAVAAAIPVVERQQVAQAAAGAAGYGSVGGSMGMITGNWRTVTTGTGDRCAVDAPSVSGYGTRFFTGAYCRGARTAGLIT